jgi:CheY-like chemotaxis protein
MPHRPHERAGRPLRPLASGPRWSRRADARSHLASELFVSFERQEPAGPHLYDETAAAPPVLLVDDNDFGRETLGKILEAEGLRVLRARDGREALCTSRGFPRPRLILLDLFMPRLDGWQFLREQQRDPALRDIPVIVISAADSSVLCQASSAVVAHFEKPVSVDGLLAAIHRHLPVG